MSADMLAGVLLGALIGIPIGRAWAEIRRARHDMRKIWDSRKSYRGK